MDAHAAESTRLATAQPKWRPSLAQVMAALLGFVLLLPLASLIFLHVFQNHLVRQAESRLIAQTAALSAALAEEVRNYAAFLPTGAAASREALKDIEPRLDVRAHSPLPHPPQAKPAKATLPQALAPLAARLTRMLRLTERIAGGRLLVLDALGRPITEENMRTARSYAHEPEVARALRGHYASALRLDDAPGRHLRVWVAMPIIAEGHVRGVVLAGRTPASLTDVIMRQKARLALAALIVLAVAAFMGWIMIRTVTGPLRELTRRTQAIGEGRRDMQRPLTRHGTREIARLSDEMLKMSHRLFERSDYIARFAAHVSHELKSPLTAIRGAAELMLDADDSMDAAQRRKFLTTMLNETKRMTRLVERMRALAAADNPAMGGTVAMRDVVRALRERFTDAAITLQGEANLPMTKENALIVFSNLTDNALRHGAQHITITTKTHNGQMHIRFADDGEGISEGNAQRIFEPFFTTRRDKGGTGMGLAITAAMLRAHGGTIRLIPSKKGATFNITLPQA